MTVQEWLGYDNQLGIDIWERKYRYNNESFDEWITRVSGKNIAIAELIKEKKSYLEVAFLLIEVLRIKDVKLVSVIAM